MKKTILLSTTLFVVGTLTACSTMHHPDGNMRHRDNVHMPHLSAEDKAQHKAMMKQFDKACEGQPNGQNVQLRVNDQVLEGKCEMRFKPNHPNKEQLPPPMPTAP